MKNLIYKRNILIVAVIFIAVFLFALTTGSADISVKDIFNMVMNKLIGNSTGETKETIFFSIRIPRVIFSGIVGAALAVVGLIYQSILKNSMADPFITGSSSGAALGAAVAIAFFPSVIGGKVIFIISAFIFSAAATFFSWFIGIKNGRVNAETIVLAGVAVNFFSSSSVAMIMIFKREALEKILFWTMGSFAYSNIEEIVIIIIITVIISTIYFIFAREIDLIVSGDETAHTTGVNVFKVKMVLIAVSALLVAVLVTFTGIVGFAGLIIPHISNRFNGKKIKDNIVFTLILGATFMMLCDSFARILFSPMELPVGVITSFIGAPYFIYLLKKRRNFNE
jgi:iron complex transport system permease protein